MKIVARSKQISGTAKRFNDAEMVEFHLVRGSILTVTGFAVAA